MNEAGRGKQTKCRALSELRCRRICINSTTRFAITHQFKHRNILEVNHQTFCSFRTRFEAENFSNVDRNKDCRTMFLRIYRRISIDIFPCYKDIVQAFVDFVNFFINPEGLHRVLLYTHLKQKKNVLRCTSNCFQISMYRLISSCQRQQMLQVPLTSDKFQTRQ